MPAPVVNTVADKVENLSKAEAESIWEEVKTSLRGDGEIPSSDDEMTDEDWGLVTDAFLTTISARFDVAKSSLTEEKRSETVLFRNIRGTDRSKIISILRDRGWFPNEDLKNIITANTRKQFKQAVQKASKNISAQRFKKFMDILGRLLHKATVTEKFIQDDISVNKFVNKFES